MENLKKEILDKVLLQEPVFSSADCYDSVGVYHRCPHCNAIRHRIVDQWDKDVFVDCRPIGFKLVLPNGESVDAEEPCGKSYVIRAESNPTLKIGTINYEN